MAVCISTCCSVEDGTYFIPSPVSREVDPSRKPPRVQLVPSEHFDQLVAPLARPGLSWMVCPWAAFGVGPLFATLSDPKRGELPRKCFPVPCRAGSLWDCTPEVTRNSSSGYPHSVVLPVKEDPPWRCGRIGNRRAAIRRRSSEESKLMGAPRFVDRIYLALLTAVCTLCPC